MMIAACLVTWISFTSLVNAKEEAASSLVDICQGDTSTLSIDVTMKKRRIKIFKVL